MKKILFIIIALVSLVQCTTKHSTHEVPVAGNTLSDLLGLLDGNLDSIPSRFYSLLDLDSMFFDGVTPSAYRILMSRPMTGGGMMALIRSKDCHNVNCEGLVTVFGLYSTRNQIIKSEEYLEFTSNFKVITFEHEMYVIARDDYQTSSGEPDRREVLIVFFNGQIKRVNQYPKEDLRIIRNYVFAQYGYAFKDPDLAQYFKQFEWYSPTQNNVDGNLTNNDKKIIQAILALEKK